MKFEFIDLIFSTVILLFAVLGLINGFVKELFSKIAIILSVFCAVTFSSRLSYVFASLIENRTVDWILAFLVIFIATFLVVKIIQTLMERISTFSILNSLDKTLGFAFGFLQGLFIIAVFLILAFAQPWFDFEPVGEKSFYYNLLKNMINPLIERIGTVLA